MTTTDRVNDPSTDPAAPAAVAVPAATQRAITTYHPDLTVHRLTEADWQAWAPLLRSHALTAARSAPHSKDLMSAASGLLGWALSSRTLTPAHPDRLLRTTTIDRYLSTLTGRPPTSVATIGSLLRALAAATPAATSAAAASPDAGEPVADGPAGADTGVQLLNEAAPSDLDSLGLTEAGPYWDLLAAIRDRVLAGHPGALRPRVENLTRWQAVPYGHIEVARMLNAVTNASMDRRLRVAARAYLCLGLGAGLSAGEMGRVTGAHVTRDPATGQVLVTVPTQDRQAVLRAVPVLAPFAPMLADLADTAGGTQLLRGRARGMTRNRPAQVASAIATRDPHAVRADTLRMSATWLTVHAACGTPLRELLRIAGLSTSEALDRVQPYVPSTRRDASQPWAATVLSVPAPAPRTGRQHPADIAPPARARATVNKRPR